MHVHVSLERVVFVLGYVVVRQELHHVRTDALNAAVAVGALDGKLPRVDFYLEALAEAVAVEAVLALQQAQVGEVDLF